MNKPTWNAEIARIPGTSSSEPISYPDQCSAGAPQDRANDSSIGIKALHFKPSDSKDSA